MRVRQYMQKAQYKRQNQVRPNAWDLRDILGQHLLL